jgi:hypothetical protein
VAAVANVAINVDSRDASRKLREVTNRSKEVSKAAGTASYNVQRLGVAFRSTVAPLVALTGAATFLGRSLAVLGKRQADAAALANGLKKIGEGEGELRRLQKTADELGKATLFNQEDFDAGFTLLTSFRRIGVDTYGRVAKAAADVAQVTGQDVRSSLMQLSKALEDPSKRVTDLARSGTVFTEQQKEQIKVLQESGRLIEAQNLILSEIEAQYGGAAEAAGKAGYAGAVDSLGESFRDFQERLAQGVEPAVINATKALTSLFDTLNKIPQPVGQAALGVAAVATGIVALKAAALAAIPAIKSLFLLLAANPFIALAAGLTAATVALAGYRNESERIADAAAGGGAAEVQAARTKLLETEQEISLKKMALEDATGRKAQQIRRELKRLRDNANALRASIPKVTAPGAPDQSGLDPQIIAGASSSKAADDLQRRLEVGASIEQQLTREIELRSASTELDRQLLQIQYELEDTLARINKNAADSQKGMLANLAQMNAEQENIEAIQNSFSDFFKQSQEQTAALAQAQMQFSEFFKKEAEQVNALDDALAGVGQTLGNSLMNAFDALINKTSSFNDILSDTLKQLGSLLIRAGLNTLADSGGAGGSILSFLGFGTRATGGPVQPNGTYLVGERGPELLTMGNQSGFVHRNTSEAMDRYRPGGSSGGGGGSLNVNYNVTQINGMNFVTEEQFREGMTKAAKDGAKMGEAGTFKTMRNSRSSRARVGL